MKKKGSIDLRSLFWFRMKSIFYRVFDHSIQFRFVMSSILLFIVLFRFVQKNTEDIILSATPITPFASKQRHKILYFHIRF